jgi:hypothetical protein
LLVLSAVTRLARRASLRFVSGAKYWGGCGVFNAVLMGF